jgi:predicted nucleotidyltransferase
MPLLAELLGSQVPIGDDVPRQWVFYGSRVSGLAGTDSDYDVLLVHADQTLSPVRLAAVVDGLPATVYALSEQDLEDDAKSRKYGGYFALKLFAPFLVYPSGRERCLLELPATFLGPFLDRSESLRTRKQVLAAAYLAFLDIYPDFDTYLAAWFGDRERFNAIWSLQEKYLVDAFERTGAVTTVGDDRFRFGPPDSKADLRRERSRAAARFWAFGAVCHQADAGFPDMYFRKSDGRATRAERDEALSWLNRAADNGKT